MAVRIGAPACALLAGAATWVAPALAAASPARAGAPISSHAMVHTCCTPAELKERIFFESKAMGARFIRVDVELSGIFGAASGDAPEWQRLDEIIALSRRYQLPVLGIVLSPPASVAPQDADEFARLAAEVAARARETIRHWEILNEPDGSWAFQGTPEDYARMLRAAHDAIKARVPEAEIALGGLMSPSHPQWLERVFATPGANAAHAFDIANLNLRDSVRRLPWRLEAWRALLERHGFTGPVWVAEHGYPAEPAYQTDPAFRGGEAAQASFLTESVLSLARAGADQVFVTFRDNLSQRFLSEGVTSIDVALPHEVRRKPAFAAMRRLVDNWEELAAAHAERQLQEARARRANRRAATATRRVRTLRGLLRSARQVLARLRARQSRARLPERRARLAVRVVRAGLRVRRRESDVLRARVLADVHRSRAFLHSQRALDLANRVAWR